MTFVDTGAWLALHHRADADHAVAAAWYRSARRQFLITDFVLDELLTLRRARGQSILGFEVVRAILEHGLATVHWVDEQDFRGALEVFASFADKRWSFTDCVSKVVMTRLGIRSAFAFDHHFRQFGDLEVLP